MQARTIVLIVVASVIGLLIIIAIIGFVIWKNKENIKKAAAVAKVAAKSDSSTALNQKVVSNFRTAHLLSNVNQ